jgi:hypothetical protein
MSSSAVDLESVTDLITARLGYLEVLVARWGSRLPWSCEDVLAAQDRGEDPTGPWRDQVRASQGAMYGVRAPAQVGAAFVLQWYLGVVANPLAWAAVIGPYVLDAAPEALTFDLAAESWFPCAVSVSPSGALVEEDAVRRREQAHARYLDHARRFVDGYRPGVKVGSRQRNGMIVDAWQMALEAASAAFDAEPVPPQMRQACCFIYALPGAQACARCPRRVVRASAESAASVS